MTGEVEAAGAAAPWIGPVRAAILAGLDVVVLTIGDLEAVVREAASVAGRLEELRIVHPGGSAGRDAPVRPGSCLGAGPGTPPAPSTMADLPVLRVPGPGERFGIVVLERDVLKEQGGFAAALLSEMFSRWEQGAPASPVLVGDVPLEHAMEFSGRDGVPDDIAGHRSAAGGPGSGRSWGHGGEGQGIWGLAGDMETAKAVRRRNWDDAMASGTWMAGARLIERPGVACIRDGSRAVIVRQAGQPGFPTSFGGRLQVFEIDADGWCRGFLVGAGTHRGVALAEIAGHAWRGGARILKQPLAGSRALNERAMVQAFVRPADTMCRTTTEAYVTTPVADLVEDIADLPLLRGLGNGAVHHAVVRRLARGEGDRRARRDFAATWPAFAGMLLDPGVAQAVDAGTETLSLVAARLGVSHAVSRRLVGRREMPRLSGADGDDRPDAEALGPLLSAIGHDRLPAPGDAEGWEALVRMADYLDDILLRAEIVRPDPRVCAGLLATGAPGWPDRWAAVQAASEHEDRSGPGDLVQAFATWMSEVAGRRVGRARALELMGGDGSLARLYERSSRWHRDPNLLRGPSGIPDHVRWPVPFARVDLGEGWHAVCLDSPKALRDEGMSGPDGDGIPGLDHCVGSYAPACWSGSSVIVSLRRVERRIVRRVTTGELRPAPEGFFILGSRRYELSQHQGRNNGHAPRSAVEAMARLHEALQRKRVPIDETAFDPRGELPPDVSRRDEVLALLPAWRAIMPRGLGRLDAEDLAALALRDDGTVPGLDGGEADTPLAATGVR